MIAKLFFRLDENELEHTKIVYRLIDFLGDVGGVSELLIWLCLFIFGGYLNFTKTLELMCSMYETKIQTLCTTWTKENFEGGEREERDFDISLSGDSLELEAEGGVSERKINYR